MPLFSSRPLIQKDDDKDDDDDDDDDDKDDDDDVCNLIPSPTRVSYFRIYFKKI